MQAVSPLLLRDWELQRDVWILAIAYSKERGYSLESLSASCRM